MGLECAVVPVQGTNVLSTHYSSENVPAVPGVVSEHFVSPVVWESGISIAYSLQVPNQSPFYEGDERSSRQTKENKKKKQKKNITLILLNTGNANLDITSRAAIPVHDEPSS